MKPARQQDHDAMEGVSEVNEYRPWEQSGESELAYWKRMFLEASRDRVEDDHLYTMLVSSVRYALGRRTYIVSFTCEIVRHYWTRLTPNQRDVIIRDVRDENPATLGDECDRNDWAALLAWMEEHRDE